MSSLRNFFCIVLLAVSFLSDRRSRRHYPSEGRCRNGTCNQDLDVMKKFFRNTIPPCRDLLSWIALSQEHRVAVGNDLLQDAGESKRVRRTLSRRVEKRVSTIQDVASPASPIDNTYLYDSTPTVSDINSCTIPQLKNGTKLRCGQT
ncbi:hypothetical protein EDD18DRAFT_1106963 [Armillaria luteobubalina]|uniref:Uncharacterized protein n=1 Tax=Armillaria luteobubalina TaxID=153913 RepID=A0AA39Q1B7_9AGAR|nr:hypothetical protein EDD18DRAFT_1106963 [Armillaria luteobubalina]